MANKMSLIERRKFVRIPYWGEVVYSHSPPQEPEKRFDILIREHRARLKNMSIGGIQFETEDPPAVKSHIKLEIKLSEDTKPMRMNGRVAWTRPLDGHGRHAVGVEFLASSHDDMRRITTFIEKYYG